MKSYRIRTEDELVKLGWYWDSGIFRNIALSLSFSEDRIVDIWKNNISVEIVKGTLLPIFKVGLNNTPMPTSVCGHIVAEDDGSKAGHLPNVQPTYVGAKTDAEWSINEKCNCSMRDLFTVGCVCGNAKLEIAKEKGLR